MHGTLVLQLAALFASQSSPTAILPVVVGEIGVGASKVEAAARSAAEPRLGVRLLASGEVGVDRARSLRCGGDARCLADLYAPSAASSVLVVVINAVASPAVLSARLLDVATARFVAEQVVDVAPDRLRPTLLPLIAATFDAAGQRPWATVEVTRSPRDARVVFGVVAAADGEMQVPPGPVEVVATADGFSSQRIALVLEPGERRALAIELEPEPSWAASPWIWIGAASVVVAAATTVVVLTIPERDTRLCLTPCP